ncbi:MaoC dehydratase-like protein [Tamaricihabitans halophyticus]|uniref:MaoC dehydratase-like protein n=1 Tax=Tamaricihabitans halophyticus TaxID=1262583 RepID=A0A4R2R678_9PSEU|nr:MaoC/PaaZ C-terminal domain-containing protein [Tamaricihabitans halophyticus]TCP57328.1 MaoC dehydratase-like protein [Tamaricihabitans halophyticus]
MSVASVHELTATPSLAPLFGKAALAGLRKRGTGELPSTVYSQRGVRVDYARLAGYNRVCGFGVRDALPATYPHILAFPLQVKLMTADDFPFPLVGSVHLANRTTQTRQLRADEPLDIRVHAEHARPHAKGTQFDVVSQVFVADTLVWTDVSTYLRKGGGSGEQEAREQLAPPAARAMWRVPADVGRQYARVSGDHNPIHLHALTARAFGFPRAIAHGMWTKARCLAAFEGRLPEAYTVDVRFKAPVLLPAKAAFTSWRQPEGWAFELWAAGKPKPHLSGTITSS